MAPNVLLVSCLLLASRPSAEIDFERLINLDQTQKWCSGEQYANKQMVLVLFWQTSCDSAQLCRAECVVNLFVLNKRNQI